MASEYVHCNWYHVYDIYLKKKKKEVVISTQLLDGHVSCSTVASTETSLLQGDAH